MWKLMFSRMSATGIICSVRYLTSPPLTMTALLICSSNCLNIESNQYFVGGSLIQEVSSLGDGASLHFIWHPPLVKSSVDSTGWHLNADETDFEQTNGWLTGPWRWLFSKIDFSFSCFLISGVCVRVIELLIARQINGWGEGKYIFFFFCITWMEAPCTVQ